MCGEVTDAHAEYGNAGAGGAQQGGCGCGLRQDAGVEMLRFAQDGSGLFLGCLWDGLAWGFERQSGG